MTAMGVWNFINEYADAFALLFSLAAFAVSIGTLRQTRRMRNSDIALETNKALISAQAKLGEILHEPERLKASWRAHFSARGSLRSGATVAMEQELDALATEIKDLQASLLSVSKLSEKSSRSLIEATAAQVHFHATKIDQAVEKLSNSQQKLDQSIDRMIQSRPR